MLKPRKIIVPLAADKIVMDDIYFSMFLCGFDIPENFQLGVADKMATEGMRDMLCLCTQMHLKTGLMS